jgi:type I restriction enzyme S subunit
MNNLILEKPKIGRVSSDLFQNRMDSKFYLEQMYLGLTKMHNNPLVNLVSFDSISKKIVDGPFGSEVKADDYVEKGIPFLRVENVTDFGINLDDTVFITEEKNDSLKRSEGVKGNIVYTKTGAYYGKAAVLSDEYKKYNIRGDLALIDCNERIDPHFITIYLNSDFGTKISRSFSSGSTRPRITLENIKKLPIPLPTKGIQNYIGNKVRKAEEVREEAKRLREEAEKILEELIDNEVISQIFDKDKKTNYSWLNNQLMTDRLDADYYKKEYVDFDHYISSHSSKFIKLKTLAKLSKKKVAFENYDNYFLYLDISSLDEGTGIFEKNKTLVSDAPSRAQKLVFTNNILVSTVRPNRKGVGIVTKEFDSQVASTGFAVLDSSINPYFLFLLLRTDLVTNQLIRFTSGGLYPAISEEDILEVYLPIVDKEYQERLGSMVMKSTLNLLQAKNLIFEAKQDVEDLIEGKFDESKISEEVHV